jgi:Zn-dependent protease
LPELTANHLAMGLTTYVVLLFSLSVHESAHAWMAHKLGDDTALHEGRITLNPIAHIDPIGTVLLPILQIFTSFPFLGWAKPTPYDPSNFRRDVTMRTGHMLVAAAGPVSNFILALLFTGIFVLLVRGEMIGGGSGDPTTIIVVRGIQLNVVLALFNLVPIPPLDGSKVASYGLPGDIGDRYDRVMEPYGYVILLVLFATGILGYVLQPITSWLITFLFRLAY